MTGVTHPLVRLRTPAPPSRPLVARQHGRHELTGALQRLSVGSVSDPAEREAEQIAASLSASPTTSAVPVAHAGVAPVLRRQPPDDPRAAAIKKEDDARAKEQQDKALESLFDELAEVEPLKSVLAKGKEVLATTAGKIAAGELIAAVVTAFVLAKEELPVTSATIDLGKATTKLSGVNLKLTWKGPANNPTEAGADVILGAPKGTFLSLGGKAGSTTVPQANLGLGFKTDIGPVKGAEFKFSGSIDANRDVGGNFSLTIPLGKVDKKRRSGPEGSPFSQPDLAHDPSIRRSPAPGAGGPSPAVPASVHAVLAQPGTTLPGDVRAAMEGAFGADFSGVRIHADPGAAASATAVGALAYTVGPHVVLGPGRWPPTGAASRHTLAHELAHVVQQGAADEVGR